MASGFLAPTGAAAATYTIPSAGDAIFVVGDLDFSVTGIATNTPLTFSVGTTVNGTGPTPSSTITETLNVSAGNTYQVALNGVLSDYTPGDTVTIGMFMSAASLVGSTVTIQNEMFTAMLVTGNSG